MESPEFDCPPPDPRPRPPRIPLPDHSCDCHAHVIGPADRFPFVEDRSYTPPDALLKDYLAMIRTLGISRCVLVQPSMHGIDNTVMLDAIASLDPGTDPEMRAVAVIPTDITDRELEELHERSVRGIRLNLVYAGGGVGLDVAERMAERIAPFGWHIQVLIDVSAVADMLPRLGRLRVPLVVDHLGHFPAGRGAGDEGFQALLELTRRGNTWVKLSGAYRLAEHGLPYDDVRPLAEALVEAAPGRMVWGTDWPHTLCRGRMPNDGELADIFRSWIADDALFEVVMVSNPAELYSFERL